MRDTTEITREIERKRRGQPEVDVTIEVAWDDSERARQLADDLADSVHDELDSR